LINGATSTAFWIKLGQLILNVSVPLQRPGRLEQFVADSPLEGAGFEQSVSATHF
jgi:hypothetical protein